MVCSLILCFFVTSATAIAQDRDYLLFGETAFSNRTPCHCESHSRKLRLARRTSATQEP